MLLIGDIYPTSRCGNVEILHYGPLTVRFLDTGFERTVREVNLLRGNVADPYAKTRRGVGFMGVGKWSSGKGTMSKKGKKANQLWNNMLQRCYDDAFQLRQPSYVGCTVVKRWHNFQKFCDDITAMPNWSRKGFDLDKDLRVKGNKKYGPQYCSFIPHSINMILGSGGTKRHGVQKRTNGWVAYISLYNKMTTLGVFPTRKEARKVYLTAKKRYLRAETRRWRDDLHIDVYETLMSLTRKDLR